MRGGHSLARLVANGLVEAPARDQDRVDVIHFHVGASRQNSADIVTHGH